MDYKSFTEEYNKIILWYIEEWLQLEDMLIDEEESKKAIWRWFTPEKYFEYKMTLKDWPISKGKWDDLKFED